jgi:hypothetical protein
MPPYSEEEADYVDVMLREMNGGEFVSSRISSDP